MITDMGNKINILLADDHSLIRQGLVFLLEELDVNCTVIHAANLQQTMDAIQNQPVNIAVIDAHFPDGKSITVLEQAKNINSNIKILIFTGIDETAHALKYINAGANGFLSKMSEEDEVKAALLSMINHGEYLSAKVRTLLFTAVKNPRLINPLSCLTEREMEIAKLYAKGYGNLEIANTLNIRQNTVSTLKKRIFEKLKIDNIVALVDLIKEHHQ